MSFEDLLKPPADNQVSVDGVQFRDADSFYDENGQLYRMQNVSAPEITKTNLDGTVEFGEKGGLESTNQAAALARSLGFTEVVDLGLDDTGQRRLGDLRNPETGELFSRRSISSGLMDVHPDFDPGGMLTDHAKFGALMRTAGDYEKDDFDKAADKVWEATEAWKSSADNFKQAQAYSGQISHIEDLIDYKRETGAHEYEIQQLQKAKEKLSQTSAGIQYSDRDLSGDANNPLSTAWDTGWLGLTESMYGFAELLGETAGWEGLDEWSEEGLSRARANLLDQGRFTADFSDVNNFGSAMEYLGTNLVMSLPYMAATTVATLAAPITGGVSYAVPVAMYTGSTWNEMEGDRSAGVAVAAGTVQAALDVAGLKLIGLGKGMNHPKDVFNAGVKTLMDSGMKKEAAEAFLGTQTRLQAAKLAGEAAKVAKKQITSKRVMLDGLASLAKGGAGEGLTEAMQELTAYTAAVQGSDKTFDYDELVNRMTNAVVAGGTIGAGFGTIGGLRDKMKWRDVAYRQAPMDDKIRSEAEQWAAQEEAEHGYVPSIQEETAKVETGGQHTPSDVRRERNDKRKRGRTFEEKATDIFESIPALWRKQSRTIFDKVEGYRTGRLMRDMYGGALQKVFNGRTHEEYKHFLVTEYRNFMPLAQEFWTDVSGGKRLNYKQKRKIGSDFYRNVQNAMDDKGNLDLNLVKPEYQLLAQRMSQLGDKLHDDQVKYNKDLGFINNWALTYKGMNKDMVLSQQPEFIALLQSEYGMDAAEAKRIAHEIAYNPEIHSVDEAYSLGKGAPTPGFHKKRTLGIAQNPKFDKFMETDPYTNMSNASKAAARYQAHAEFVGVNNEKLDAMLDQLEKEGAPQEVVDEIAQQMQNYLDAESGNYKRPQSDFWRTMEKLQRHLMFFMAVAGLPLATISSFVELALVTKGMTNDQIYGPGKNTLQTIGKEFAATLWSGMTAGKDVATRTMHMPDQDSTAGRQWLRDTGFYSWDVGAATTTGVADSTAFQQRMLETFFTAIGLSGWTNFTRAARASIGMDFINDKVMRILEAGENPTRDTQEAREQLRNLGVDVNMYTYYSSMLQRGELDADPEGKKEYEEMTKTAIYNFINEAVALPSASNRPLFYQDPRFALFTQFQGFVSTFTANHIPKMWGEYVKRGTPEMTYSAFQTMAIMIMMGFVSQYLKDLLKYGEIREFGEHPHLETPEYIQRGIRASGLLGTGERVLDQFFPIYDQQSSNPGEWLWNTTSSEAPSISYLKRIGNAVGSLAKGDVSRGVYETSRATPVLGPFNFIGDAAAEAVKDWNFNGK